MIFPGERARTTLTSSMSDRQKGLSFYVLTFFMAVAVAISGPADDDRLQILNMAVIAPTMILCVSYGVAWLVGVLDFHVEADALTNLLINVVLISLYAVLEEIGWRGYALPHLGRDGSIRAALLVGFLHGVWHLPLMLLTTAYNPAGNRLITVPVFLAVVTGAGLVYAYLLWTSGSLWPVAIAHGTLNAALGTFQQAAVTRDPATAAYVTGETGVFTLAAVGITAAALAGRYSRATKAGNVARSLTTSRDTRGLR